MWFRELVGFDETNGEEVRAQLRIESERMTSLANGREMGCGTLEMPSLGELRDRTADLVSGVGPTTIREVVGDVAALHRDPANAGATFQAASQFNLLEMASPNVTPEAGVDIYEHDHTQGPACAIACGAGTIYRNYLVEIDGRPGQTADRQLDGLADLGRFLFPDAGAPWSMRNGYAMFDRPALDAVGERLASMSVDDLDEARGYLRVGVHRSVEVTSAATAHEVTQVYCSALPVAYNRQPAHLFESLARLVLDATYESTLRAAAETRAATGNPTVFLTLVGGGVFGNQSAWIFDTIQRSLDTVADAGLDVVVVSYGSPHPGVANLEAPHR
ncbi:MAG: hypothetical protein ACRBI6_17815 [Acidimicrobiales bacterium]